MATRQTAGRPANNVKRIAPKVEAVEDLDTSKGIDLDALIAQRAEALGLDDGSRFPLRFQGAVFHMPHPMFADDSWFKEMAGMTDDRELITHCLGSEEETDRYLALGGRSTFLVLAIQAASQEYAGVDAEGKVTASGQFSNRSQRRQK